MSENEKQSVEKYAYLSKQSLQVAVLVRSQLEI